MKDKSSKKVVIINDIQSDAIEQAIFILRSSGAPAAPASPGAYRIVAEAQQIIDSYIQTVERTDPKPPPRFRQDPPRRRGGLLCRALYVALAAAGFLGASYLLTHLFAAILEKF